jgi:hypothetical protein
VLRGERLVCVAVKVRRVHGCLRSQAVVQVAVVNSVTVGRRRCSRCGLRSLSPWQRSEAVDVARPPRSEARISGCPWNRDESVC